MKPFLPPLAKVFPPRHCFWLAAVGHTINGRLPRPLAHADSNGSGFGSGERRSAQGARHLYPVKLFFRGNSDHEAAALHNP